MWKNSIKAGAAALGGFIVAAIPAAASSATDLANETTDTMVAWVPILLIFGLLSAALGLLFTVFKKIRV